MAVGGGRVYVGIGMMYQMKPPHPLHFVFGPVDKIRADQIQQQHPYHGIRPQRHLGQPLQNAEIVRDSPIARLEQNEGHGKVDDDGGDGKKDIDSRVLPLIVAKAEQRKCSLDEPE